MVGGGSRAPRPAELLLRARRQRRCWAGPRGGGRAGCGGGARGWPGAAPGRPGGRGAGRCPAAGAVRATRARASCAPERAKHALQNAALSALWRVGVPGSWGHTYARQACVRGVTVVFVPHQGQLPPWMWDLCTDICNSVHPKAVVGEPVLECVRMRVHPLPPPSPQRAPLTFLERMLPALAASPRPDWRADAPLPAGVPSPHPRRWLSASSSPAEDPAGHGAHTACPSRGGCASWGPP